MSAMTAWPYALMMKSKRAFFQTFGVDHRYGQVQDRRMTRLVFCPEESIMEAELVSHFSPHSSHS
jgi:hypothetical protein